MWLVLCHCSDLAAIWAYEGLKALGMGPLELVSAESLAFSLKWEHRIRTNSASFRITLADGREIASEKVFGALNRLQFVPLPHWHRASLQDQSYVGQEMMAFYTSWLFSMPGRVLNPATPAGLSGAMRRPLEWMRLASQAGLPTAGYQADHSPLSASATMKSVIVVGGITPADAPYPEACGKLAEISKTPLLGISFSMLSDGTLRFCEADTMPDLRLGGPCLLDSLKACLERGLQ